MNNFAFFLLPFSLFVVFYLLWIIRVQVLELHRYFFSLRFLLLSQFRVRPLKALSLKGRFCDRTSRLVFESNTLAFFQLVSVYLTKYVDKSISEEVGYPKYFYLVIYKAYIIADIDNTIA